MSNIQIYHTPEGIPKKERTIILGNFDGLHLGHQQLINLGVDVARRDHTSAMVLTFFPQYQSIINPHFRSILAQQTKFRLLAKMQVEEILTLPFDEKIEKCSAEDFFYQILLGQLKAKNLVVGYNFSFGYQGKGTPDYLREMAQEAGITVHVLPPFKQNGQLVSSTLIRNLLREGDVEGANNLLGHCYLLEGYVITGKQLGRTIGIPTANIAFDEHLLLPKLGVYAAKVVIEGYHESYQGVLNIGLRPTVEETATVNLEVHILDFDDDIYDKHIAIEVFSFLREEVKFANLVELQKQITWDIESTINYFQKVQG